MMANRRAGRFGLACRQDERFSRYALTVADNRASGHHRLSKNHILKMNVFAKHLASTLDVSIHG
jgi:hypothetical protein